MTDRFRWRLDPATTVAMAGAATIGAQFIAGKASRDALFLAYFEPTALPAVMIATSVFSIILVVAGSRRLGHVPPGSYVPVAFAVSAALLLVEWGLTFTAPKVAAILLYLHVSGVGPMLGSGFWLIASERFDPRTAKKRFGQIGGAGTIGGLVGGLVAARLSTAAGVSAILLLLAALNALCAWHTRSLAHLPAGAVPVRGGPAALPARSGARVLVDTPYLRNLALLVLLGTIAAAFVDYVFKVQVKASFGPGPSLGSFFSLYYSAVSVLTFALQAFGSRAVLERLGLSAAMSAPSLTFVVGTAASLLVPGLRSVVATRASEAAFRGSLLHSGYELFYTPIAPHDKRAVKAVIDVGVNRSGDIIGAGIIQILLWVFQDSQTATLLGLALGCSSLALVVASRSSRGYARALEQGIIERAVEIDLKDVPDRLTRTIVLRTLNRSRPAHATAPTGTTVPVATRTDADPEVQDILALRSRRPDTVLGVLRRDGALSLSLVPHVIPLLAWDAVADDAVRALRTVAEECLGELISTLIDPDQPFVVRRRLARVLSACVSQRAADGLLLGLEDLRFEVRVRCGRSLAAVVAKSSQVRLDPARLLAVVQREVTVSRRVWEGRQVIDDASAAGGERSPLEELVGDRACRALEHVFTLLALVLPAEQLRLAYLGLHTADRKMRGLALEYLDSALPPEVRDRLWPFLESDGPPRPTGRSRDEILQDLLRSNQSILLDLKGRKTRGD
ncbi:MAG: hypothetical protein ACRD3C_07240 [Vicinamibacterales bacterium]